MENIMNKNNRRTLPMVMALLVVVTVMCAVGSASDLRLGKESNPPGATYTAGETITYDLLVENTHLTHSAVVDIWDVFPDGSTQTLATGITLNPGDIVTYTTTYTTTMDDIPEACNSLHVEGEQGGVYVYLTLGTCNDVNPPPTPTPTPTYSTPPTDVPAQTPLGIVALIGLLGLIGAGMIIGRK